MSPVTESWAGLFPASHSLSQGPVTALAFAEPQGCQVSTVLGDAAQLLLKRLEPVGAYH